MKFATAVSARDCGMLLAGGLLASIVWFALAKASSVAEPAPIAVISTPSRDSDALSGTPGRYAPVGPATDQRPLAAEVPPAKTSPAGFTAQSVRTPALPQPTANYDGLSIDDLRLLVKQNDSGAMVALAKLLMTPPHVDAGLGEANRLIDEAIARGSTDAVMVFAEETLMLKFRMNPEIGEDDLYLPRQLAAARYVTALLMGDLRALEGVQAVLPSNPTSGYVVGVLRGGYIGYQQMLERRAELGLPPFSAHIPPYKWQPLDRALYEASLKP